jgi:RNA polymerase sigma-70 factor (sigma-E family)
MACEVEVPLSTEASFAAFFAETKAPMYRLAYLLTGSAAQAEEAVQESFVRVFERWARIDDPGAYLRRAIVNRCTSWHRHRAVVLRTQSRVATHESYVDQPDELTDALAQLPARRRAVIVLRYYERLDLEEIADSLGISVGTVKSTLHRALAQLKGTLE